MTVAVVVKVFDGVVLAADSAATLPLANGSYQVWNNADKVFHLHRQLPIGAMTWGLGTIGSASISTLVKDLRRRFMGRDPEHYKDWALNPAEYSIEAVTKRLVEMFFELWLNVFSESPAPSPLGLLVAGYSAGERQSEAWQVLMEDSSKEPVPQLVAAKETAGWEAWAQPDATLRLWSGFDPGLPGMLRAALTAGEWEKIRPIFEDGRLSVQPAVPPMPLPDAIQLARYLVDVTIGFSHYSLGPDTVGGPVEVASISRHEGFKWISRKHYYPPSLNPEDPKHDY